MAGRLAGLSIFHRMKSMAPGKRGLAVVLEREAAKQAQKSATDHSLDSITGLQIGEGFISSLKVGHLL
jgi:hypothetical protein